MWVRAVWLENGFEEEGVIPSVWVQDDVVRWPNELNVLRARQEQRVPSDKWHTFPLVKVKFTSADMDLCAKFNFTTSPETSDSDVNEDDNENPKGPESSKHRSNTISSGSEDEDDVFSPKDFPSPPGTPNPQITSTPLKHSSSHIKVKKKSSVAPVSSCTQSKRKPAERERPSRLQPPNKKARSTSLQEQRPARKVLPPQSTNDASHELSNLSTIAEDICTIKSTNQAEKSANTFPMSEAKFQRRVLHLLTEIRNTLQQVGKKYEPAESEFHIEKLTDLSQLEELEDELQTEEARKLMLLRISKIGGTSLKTCVHNVMFRLMTNEVMAGINMSGNGGKVAFRKTTICKLITEMALASHGGTESDVVHVCSRLLKYAPDRKGGGGCKENVPQNVLQNVPQNVP